MIIVVIGLGSMGRRRIRLLKKLNEKNTVIGVDSNQERCLQSEKEFGIVTSQNLDRVFEIYRPECAVISTSPLSHAKLINICLVHKCHIFTEINLVSDMYKDNITLANQNNKLLFLSSTFLYREEIKYIKKRLEVEEKPVIYNYHVGQYLPDWHPWESINDFFVSDNRTSGCRELFAIELPWIVSVFGKIKSYRMLKNKNSTLKIDYNDNYQLIIEHENGNKGVYIVDVVSRKPVRNLELYNEDIYITWHGTPTTLVEYDIEKKCDREIELYDSVSSRNDYASFVIENAYEDELRCFFDAIEGKSEPRYSFMEDLYILDFIDKIEEE